MAREELDLALADYERALAKNNRAVEAYRSRALCFDRLKRPQEAMADLGKLLTLDPGDTRARNLRGRWHRVQGRPDLAIVDWRASLAVDHAQIPVYLWLSHQLLLGPPTIRQPTEALRHLQHVENTQSDSEKSFNGQQCIWLRGVAYYRLRQFEKAIEVLTRPMIPQPDRLHGHAHLVLALCHAQLDRPEDARSHFVQAVSWRERTTLSAESLEDFNVRVEEVSALIKTGPLRA